MLNLGNLVGIGVYKDPETVSRDLESGMDHYNVNIWYANNPDKPNIVPIKYRGGYIGGFNDCLIDNNHLFIADGERILHKNINNLAQSLYELENVDEVSDMICKTNDYLISSLKGAYFQIRSLKEIYGSFGPTDKHTVTINVPFKTFKFDPDLGNTLLSFFTIEIKNQNLVLMNNADDKSYLFNPDTGSLSLVKDITNGKFLNTFQRREKYHIFQNNQSELLFYTESLSDTEYQNRVYSLSTRDPPILKELEPLEIPDKKLLSMHALKNSQLEMLVNYNDTSLIEIYDQNNNMINSQPLKRHYEYGDRLQRVEDQLLIVRHMRNEIVEVKSENSVKLVGAENNVAIPEISSIWEYPQYLYVAKINKTDN